MTSTPAEMLGLKGVKGSLGAGADADLVIFSEDRDAGGAAQLVVDEVWKFGTRVYHKGDPFSPVYTPVETSPTTNSSPDPDFQL